MEVPHADCALEITDSFVQWLKDHFGLTDQDVQGICDTLPSQDSEIQTLALNELTGLLSCNVLACLDTPHTAQVSGCRRSTPFAGVLCLKAT